jgi:hypothetical protein
VQAKSAEEKLAQAERLVRRRIHSKKLRDMCTVAEGVKSAIMANSGVFYRLSHTPLTGSDVELAHWLHVRVARAIGCAVAAAQPMSVPDAQCASCAAANAFYI